jgi:3-isopropylmalate/(R)-2-methylmalate dehydratase small subunit
MSAESSKRSRVSGRAVAVRGNDIDTDRIIPARFLKTITFDGLGDHLFEDDRRQAAERGVTHPIEAAARQGVRILVVGANFGCGSSREHAPQAIARFGVDAIIGESFGEIFFGNSLMIGLPCATASREDIDKLSTAVEQNPAAEFVFDLATSRVTGPGVELGVAMPDAVRIALVNGTWDATSLLVDRYDEVEGVAARLPYLSGWGASSGA